MGFIHSLDRATLRTGADAGRLTLMGCEDVEAADGMVRSPFRIALVSGVAALVGCAKRVSPPVFDPAPSSAVEIRPCTQCSTPELSGELRTALETRISVLKTLGGSCRTYGEVLETSLAEGRIGLRPYMWRVNGRLASAQAKAGGDIVVARDIDSLNVGVRKVADVVKSVEHEAAHIAFAMRSGPESSEVSVESHVVDCLRPLTSP